jgi:hypothetical protein
MKYLIGLILSLISVMAIADTLRCYSHGTLIYSGEGKDASYDMGIFSMTEDKTKKVVFIFGDCIVKVDA